MADFMDAKFPEHFDKVKVVNLSSLYHFLFPLSNRWEEKADPKGDKIQKIRWS